LVENLSRDVVDALAVLKVRDDELVRKEVLLEGLAAFRDCDLADLRILRRDPVRADVTDGIDAAEALLADLGRVLLPALKELREDRRIDRAVAGHEFFDAAEDDLVGRHRLGPFLKFALDS